jgi:hypothetical protein
MQSGGQASGQLNVGGTPPPPSEPQPQAQQTGDRMQAVINCHGANLQQIEVAIQANAHTTDPHPAQTGASLTRHPVILSCFDPSSVDANGSPAEGKPAELNMTAIREIFSARYPHVSAEGPPADGSHVQVAGMHVIAEKDMVGNPTGRVRLGNAEEVD